MSAFLVVFAYCYGTSSADQVIVAGDSWGVQGWKVLQEVLQSHNNTKDLKVKSYARTGTTSSDWIKPTTKLVDDINKNSDAQYLWLTIGGNDAAGLSLCESALHFGIAFQPKYMFANRLPSTMHR